MKKTGRLFAALIMLLLVTLSLAACGSDESNDPSVTKLDVGYGFGFGTNYAADAFGLERLEQDGITVETQELGSPQDAIAALDGGQIDVANVGLAHVVSAVQEGAKVIAVVPVTTRYDLLVVGGPKVKSVAELKDKTLMIGSNRGATGAFVMNLLDQHGLGPDTVNLPEVRDSSTRIVALRAGRIDAAVLDQLDLTRLQLEHDHYTVLGAVADVQPRSPGNVWAFSKSFVEQHPDVVQTFVSRMLDGYEEALTDEGRERFLRDVQAGVLKGEDPKLAETVYDWYREVDYWPSRANVWDEESYAELIAYWEKSDAVDPNPPAFEDVFDTTFWEKA